MIITKKWIILLLSVVLVFGLVGCGNDYSDNKIESSEQYEAEKQTASEEVLETSEEIESSSTNTADDIIERYNSKIQEMYSGSTESEINSVLVSFDGKEYIPQYAVTSYEYSVPSNSLGMCIFEDENSREAIFGSIELNLDSYNKQNEAGVLQGFVQMCYFFSYAFDTSITEDEFMSIWSDIRNSGNKQVIYSDVMYKIQDDGNYLSFSIKYN